MDHLSNYHAHLPAPRTNRFLSAEMIRAYHQTMAIFHHHAAIVAMGDQLISQSHPSETIGQNIDPALHGQELSGWVLPLDAAAGGDLGAMPSTGEYDAEGELLRANVEEWIIDPRLRTSAGSLEPPSAGGGNFHSTAGGCIDGIVPVGEMQNYLNDWQEDHSSFLENTAQQWQCLSSSADDTAAADTAPGKAAGAQCGNGPAAAMALVSDDTSTSVSAEGIVAAVKKRRVRRKQVPSLAGSSASGQPGASNSKVRKATRGRKTLAKLQEAPVPVVVQSTAQLEPTAASQVSPEPASTAQPEPAAASQVSPEPASAVPPATVLFPHKPRGKRTKCLAWYRETASDTVTSPPDDSTPATEPVRSAAGAYRCDVCQSQWPCRSALLRHSYKHTKHLSYPCVCGKVFSRCDTLRVHCRKVGCVLVPKGEPAA